MFLAIDNTVKVVDNTNTSSLLYIGIGVSVLLVGLIFVMRRRG